MRIAKKLKRWICAAAALMLLAFPMSNVSAAGKEVNMFADNTNIKGMQGIENIDAQHVTYGTKHRLINIEINRCYLPEDHPWIAAGYVAPYNYHGKNYYFLIPEDYRKALRVAVLNNESISVAFLMRWDDQCSWLIDSAARQPGHTYYALETKGEAGEWLGAFFTCICKELLLDSYELSGHPPVDLRIDNFILGNEVNMPNTWNYFGSTDTRTCATKYANAFRIMYNTVREYSSTARCSISLDHSWNDNDQGRGMAGKAFLDVFAEQLGPDVDWCVSYHLYPSVLTKATIWTDYYGMDLNPVRSDARFVDGRNLSVMTNYVKNTYGEQHRIMLTEQGFTRAQGDGVQGAALAYSYYAALYDPMVDSFLLNNKNEGGSLDFSLGWLAEEVYKKIGNGNAADQEWIANQCLPIIGVSSWNQIIPNYGVLPEPWQPEILPAGITLNQTSVSIWEGDSLQLTATVSPEDATDKSVTWTSSNPGVATVNNGVVTAVSAGETVITAQTVNGVMATCNVTVSKKIYPEKITLSMESLTGVKGDTYQLSANVTPDDAFDRSVVWSSSNTAVATVNNSGMVKFVGPGNAVITAKTINGLTAKCDIGVVLDLDPNNPFGDVSTSGWEYKFVSAVKESGLMTGKGDIIPGKIKFDPNATITRAEFVQTLYSSMGKPDVTYEDRFKDVPDGQWFTNAVLWASNNNITSGIKDGTIFGVYEPIQREQMALMLYKYVQIRENAENPEDPEDSEDPDDPEEPEDSEDSDDPDDPEEPEDSEDPDDPEEVENDSAEDVLEKFLDQDKVSPWAREALEWAVEKGVIAGSGDAKTGYSIEPQAHATRAVCATMLYRVMEMFETSAPD